MAKKNSTSLTASVSAQMKKGFNLNSFKNKKGLGGNVKFKEQKWIPLSPAFQEITSVAGIPLGHVVLLRGHTDTGKTTALIEAATAAQKHGILPVFIITEMKWNWEHVKKMGFKVEEVVNEETGEITNYEGDFIYVDRETLNSVEDVAAFILDLIDEQNKGNIPFEFMFLWDSVGSIPCNMSIEKKSNNNEWNAGAMSTQFGNVVNQKITLSRKESSKFTNSLVCVNKVWVAKAENPMAKPKMMNKGGFTMWYDATFVATFGNIANSGTSKLKVVRKGKTVEWAKRTNIQIDKNHVNGIQSKGRVLMTPTGFISDDPKSIKKYVEEHSKEWGEILGGDDFQMIEEDEIVQVAETFMKEPE